MEFFRRFFKAVREFLLKIGSIFFHAKPPDPLLPLQNPPSTSTLSIQPLLLPTPSPISSPSSSHEEDSEYGDKYVDDSFSGGQEENYSHDNYVDDSFSGEENYSGDNYVDDSFSWRQEENYSVKTDHHVVFCSAVFIEENASRNSPFLEEAKTNKEDDEEEVKSIIMVVEEKWIKHYSSRQRILLVGEGNFSFSACLAVAFGCASNIVATSLDSEAFLKHHYWDDAMSNLEKLRSRGSKVMHGIDATTMATHKFLGQLKFDRIIYNFPYAGLSGLKDLPRQTQLELHRSLVRQFMENAREMISDEGEIHITHKTNGFHAEWRLVSLAHGTGLRLIEAVNFNRLDYPGYSTKCGFGGNKYFHCYPSKTYKFGL